MVFKIPRRAILAHVGASAGAIAAARLLPAVASVPPKLPQRVQRICFGSCADQDKDQPVWDAILATKPGLFIFLGDNIYGDTHDIHVLRAKYARLAAKPSFRKFRQQVPIIAAWDDHDYGENDSGAENPLREQSKQAFLEFWEEPKTSPRWGRDGIYTSYIFGPAGQRVQILLPDLRSNRTPLSIVEDACAMAAMGPYARMTDPAATMLGERQWSWLSQEFEKPAEVRIFGSSLQVLADFPGWEGWPVYQHDYQRLMRLISQTQSSGMVFLSGDAHYGELSLCGENTPYPLWDATSSGITEVWSKLPPNERRIGTAVREVNFGVVDIDWNGGATTITLQICDVNGRVKLRQIVPTTALTA